MTGLNAKELKTEILCTLPNLHLLSSHLVSPDLSHLPVLHQIVSPVSPPPMLTTSFSSLSLSIRVCNRSSSSLCYTFLSLSHLKETAPNYFYPIHSNFVLLYLAAITPLLLLPITPPLVIISSPTFTFVHLCYCPS
uniref:Uncharacterized protein n=1 Tax=Octopus bimaculoides TaxID=37653 RepID=A0A0L8H362_OCTBM